ncbi:MAG: hypothetical protein JRC77_11270, partial [Deltaproteobacteria bacterium]|nr:hypothetical protein [Deltaproteobacteria bacterium]
CAVFTAFDIADQKAVAFDPDEERVAVVSAQKSIQIWDVQNQCLLEELQGISEHADHIWFSGCGQHVLFESWDNGLGCWNIASGEVIENLTFLHVVDFWRSRRVFWDTEREKELLLSEVGIPESANMLIQPTSSRGSTDFSPVNRLGLRSGDAVRGDYLAMPHPEFSVIYPSSRENEWIGLSDGHLQITRLEGEIDRIG